MNRKKEKEIISITIDKELLKEIDKLIEKKMFGGRSFAIEFIVDYFVKNKNKILEELFQEARE